jgi:hypothetical protein
MIAEGVALQTVSYETENYNKEQTTMAESDEIRKQREALKEVLENSGQSIEDFEKVQPAEQLAMLEKAEQGLEAEAEIDPEPDNDIREEYFHILDKQREIIQEQEQQLAKQEPETGLESPGPEEADDLTEGKELPGDEVEGETEKASMSPEEKAFRNALDQRAKITESLKNGSLPCLPGKDGFADTEPAVNIVNGTRYHGASLLYLKDFQKRHGFPTAEYATVEAIQKSGVYIRKGEKGVTINYSVKDEKTQQWENKTARLFNVAQTTKPWELKAYAEKVNQEKEQEREAFLKKQFGDSFRPKEKKEREPGPAITCTSTEPERYLAQYLAAVSLGGSFKASPEQAGEFAQKMGDRIYERMGNGYTDPFKLSKICNEAGVQCREIIKEIKQPQPKQEQTQRLEKKQSRHI